LSGFGVAVALVIIALSATIYLTLVSNAETEDVLIDSVKAELIASSISAREIISENIELFKAINSPEDIEANWDAWIKVDAELQTLNRYINGAYIYALKEINGTYYFVFDTDSDAVDARDIFTPYELFPVHEQAFAGIPSAGIANVNDEWGSFNTGAVPLYDNKGVQVGIVATDFSDLFIERNHDTTRLYTTVLIVSTSVIMVLLLFVLFLLIRLNSRIQKRLFELANYDFVSGLPNRNYLFSYLKRIIGPLEHTKEPFAVVFFDLDNFKSVNDRAGHDKGDVLLRQIATFINAFALQSPLVRAHTLEPLSSRIGGDEFLQLLPGIATTEDATIYAQSILEAFSVHPELLEFILEFDIGLSMGISLFPSMETDYEDLIIFADVAMYHAKYAGKNNFKVYDASMGDNFEGADLIVRRSSR
jgi:diguanylate cyclase (GGDEF)-like protein